MVQITYTLRLDMRDTGIVNTSLRLKQGDSGMKIAVNVFNGGVSAFDSSTTPKIVFRRPDGASVMADMTVESSLYSYTLVGNELQVPGKELIDIKFPIGAEGRESTMSCSIEVVPDTITPNTHGSGIYDNDLAVLVEEATEAAETVQEVVGDSEAWADGTRGGVPVGPDDPAYHNNSKYWSEQANPTRLANLTDVDINTPKDGDGLVHNGNDWTNIPIMTKEQWKKNGAYNICPNIVTTQVINGVTVTVNSNKTITLNGTANAFTVINISGNILSSLDHDTTYRLVGAPANASTSSFYIYMGYQPTNSSLGVDDGNGVNFSLSQTQVTYTSVACYLVIMQGTSFSNDVIKPMITTDLNATYADYQQYAMTNRELTEFTTTEDVTSKVTFSTSITWHTGWNHIYRCGKQVWGSIRFTTPSTASNDFPIITLPTELRPASSSGVVIGALHETWYGTVAGMLNTGGSNIALASNQWSTNKNVVCTFSYLTS